MVTGWKRTLSSTLGEETTWPLRPPPEGAAAAPGRSIYAGFRHQEYYPRIPSVSEIGADGYFNFGDNLEASFPRDGFQFGH